MLQEVDSRRSQQKKAARLFTTPASPIDNPPECLKKLGHAVYFIEHDEFFLVVGKVSFGIGKSRPISRGFKVEIEGRPPLSYFESEGRFSDLSRT